MRKSMQIIPGALLQLLIGMLFILMVPSYVEAAKPYTGSRTLTKTWDITGDGKKDTIRYKPIYNSQYDMAEGMDIYINGQKSYQVKEDYYMYTVKQLTLKNKVRYIFINLTGDNDDARGLLLRYKGGKLVKEVVLADSIGKLGFHFNANLTKVSGNTLTFKAYSMSQGLGPMKFQAQYQYKKGKMRKKSSTCKVLGYSNGEKMAVNTLTVSRKVKVYKDKTGKKSAGTLKAGTKVKVTKIYQAKTYCSYYVKNKGWFKIKYTSHLSSPPFKESFYAG